MQKLRTTQLALSLALAGCATCREAPIPCAVAGAAVLVGAALAGGRADLGRPNVVLNRPTP